MNIRYILAAVILGMTAEASHAQYTQDAFRFSQADRGSTSRMKAIGNATTAVGGDLSSISNNPAGLGFFNKSEFSFTPEYDSSNIKGTYFGESLTDKRTRINFNNASVVFNGKTKVPKGYSVDQGLLSFNFGLSWNRTNNFYDRISYAGFNTTSSVADFFAAQGNAKGVMDGPAKLAYQQYLIDDDGSNGLVPTTGTSSDQDMIQKTEGGQNEFSLALGANYSNKLYLGFGIGITNVRYDSRSSLKETGLADIYNDVTNAYDRLDYLTYYDVDQSVRGSGFNFKLGVIYKPVESVRLGASFISPTWYSLSDNTSYILDTEYNKGKTSYYGDPEDYNYDYNLRTPMKLSGGVAVFIGKAGFISGDVEYVDYEGMKLSNTGSDAAQNKTISEIYKSTVNARVGAEGRLNENFYLRAGYGYLANPEKGIGSATNIISGGLGYRMNNFYVDATYTSVSRDQNVYPYEIGALSPQADLSKTHSNAYLTVGFRF